MKIKNIRILYTFIILMFCLSGCGTASEDKNPENPQNISANVSEEAPDDTTDETRNTVDNSSETSTESQTADNNTIPSDPEGETADMDKGLSVTGTSLTDAAGNPVQLRGISTHGLAWYPDYINKECFRQLKEELGINVIRLAMYTAENGGYCTDGDKDTLKSLIKEGVRYATECDMYVIIDWHILSDGNPNTHIEESKAFFQEMSGEYGTYTNVLYEICNEPNGNVSWSEIKNYAEEIIPVIRENDPEGIILVGTPNWSQSVEQAAADPITGYDNIMYTLHFYAATHKDSLRNAMVRAIEEGLPVFVSEYGICDASGNGAIDTEEANKWVDVMNSYGVSYVAWNLSNKQETSAILKNSCSKTSGFDREDLSDSGKWLYEMLTETDISEHASDIDISDNNISENKNIETQKSDESTEKNANALNVTAKVVNSWGQENETCFQYDLTLSNSADTACDNWTIQLTFSSDITLQDSWNGVFEAEGNLLTISSMDYNGYIEAGGIAENIGFILRADESCSLNTAE